jgi:hypothetical protein
MPKLLGIMAFCAFVAGAALAQDAPSCKALDYTTCNATAACAWYTVMVKADITLEDGTKIRHICKEECRPRAPRCAELPALIKRVSLRLLPTRSLNRPR